MRHHVAPVLALGVLACVARAQPIPKSQLGTVSQMVGHAQIELRYRRPVARGRELFGALVPWGKVWSPSADTAAVFTTSAPIFINGTELAAGTYSLWALPDRDEWTMIFSARSPVFHLRYPAGADVLRVTVHATPAEHMETLAFYFPMVDADSATMVMHWGTTVVPLSIRARE
jgi:Protein of unknown function (DUF2911)